MLRLFAPILLMTLTIASPALSAWQGEMVETSEGLRVINPETPAAGEVVLELQELWRIGGHDEDVMFGVVNELLVDDEGNVYLLDGQLQEIQVFDPAGQWLRTIGRAGQGPGEFNNAGDMYWAPTGQIGVIQNWPGKIVMLRPDGTPGDQFSLPYGKGGSLQAASRGFGQPGRIVLSGSAWTSDDGQQFQRTYLKAYDGQGTELVNFVETSTETQFGNFAFHEETFTDFQRRWTAGQDGRVAAPLTFDAYRIHVWNGDGSLDRIIERPDFENVRRTGAELDVFQQLYDQFTRWNPGSTFEVAPVHQTIGQMHFREDGSLWVQNARDQWRTADQGRFTSFDVYDDEGRYVQRVTLNLDADATQDGLFFAGNRLYLVTDLMAAFMSQMGTEADLDEEPEPVSVICYTFQPPAAALTRAGD